MLLLFAIVLIPVYIHNLQFHSFVASLTQTASAQAIDDDAFRSQVLAKARSLDLPVTAPDVHISHAPDGTHVDVRYFVTVSLPGYTVNLHFEPAASAR
jgi:hypothetical protein